jgi:hypothetical protein
MLSCIIVHYPYPHPPRSAHTGDTLIPGSQSESTKNYKDRILEQKLSYMKASFVRGVVPND